MTWTFASKISSVEKYVSNWNILNVEIHIRIE